MLTTIRAKNLKASAESQLIPVRPTEARFVSFAAKSLEAVS